MGDYNQDGRVNAADYVVYQNNVGDPNGLPNDNDLSPVGSGHYDLWKSNYGAVAGAGAGTGAVAATSIPEPTGWTMLLTVPSLILAARRK